MSKKRFQRPRGTYDILPQDQPWWSKVRKIIRKFVNLYRFSRIDMPIFEETDLFVRSVGQNTDIIEKQMYSFRTKGGDRYTLRPEGTASVVRAYIENGLNNLPQPLKLWYTGPMFRYERPQAGRFRQFQQFGIEIIGDLDPALDAEVIQFLFQFLKSLGLKNLIVQINSIGCSQCRPPFRRILLDYYRSKKRKICPRCAKRLKENPLRALDCKEEKCQRIAAQAPAFIDYLCDECRTHFKNVLEFLDEIEIPYFLNSHLVRGLDYYTNTVFEIFKEGEEQRAQSALGGGGRYNGLVKHLGGKDTPAVGGSLGLDRLIELMKQENIKVALPSVPSVFLIQLGDLAKKKALKLYFELQKADISVAEAFSKDSIKSQLKIADKLGAKFSLILGQQEALDKKIIIRNMETGIQEIVPIEKIILEIKKRLKK